MATGLPSQLHVILIHTPPVELVSSPETGGECSPRVFVEQLDREALEGMAVRYDVPDGILELLVANPTHSQTTLSLVRREGRGEKVTEVIVPDCAQSKFLP